MFGRCILCVVFTYVSSLLDHDIIKYIMIFFPHYLGCLLYFFNRPCIYYLRMYTSSVLLVPGMNYSMINVRINHTFNCLLIRVLCEYVAVAEAYSASCLLEYR